MNKTIRRVGLALGTGALVLALALPFTTGKSDAANLTGGTYTYVINGEEVTFPFDPIVRKDGLLVPVEVFQQFGVTVDNPLNKSFSLKKNSVTATLTLGTTTYTLNGSNAAVATTPLRLNGRLFLPADLLKEFGVESSQDGNYVFLRAYVDGGATIKQTTDSDLTGFKMGRNFTTSVKLDSNGYANGEMTLLSQDILTSAALNISYGARARLQGMLATNTLVLAKLSNFTGKSGAMATAGTYLVDDQRTQYDLQQVIDIGNGLLSNKLAPGADRVGVLVFPKVNLTANNLVLYYDNNGGSLGTFTTIK